MIYMQNEKEQTPMVSIIIPCRNEEKSIGKCLDSLVAQDYPKDSMEIITVDGESTDNTKNILDDYSKKYQFIRVLENKNKYTPISMNIGILNAKGEIISKTDAHSTYGHDYVSKCIKYMHEYDADVVGGVTYVDQKKLVTKSARAVALSLTSFLGVGNSSFRRGGEKPVWADAVFGGFYKKSIFEKTGLFNEKLFRSQDMDMHMRIKKSGFKILLAPDVKINYYPKETIKGFFFHNINDGIWAVLPKKFGVGMLKLRHLLPLFFILCILILVIFSIFSKLFFSLLIIACILYMAALFYFSAVISIYEKDFSLFPYLFFAFCARHFGYGIGSLIGLVKLVF